MNDHESLSCIYASEMKQHETFSRDAGEMHDQKLLMSVMDAGE